ncbi:hypothetical protein Dimus_030430 [Dionaea muscipula]
MMRATATDGEFRVRVACRRSSRLSPSLSTTGPDPLSEPSTNAEGVSSSGGWGWVRGSFDVEGGRGLLGFGGLCAGFYSFASFESDFRGGRQAAGVNLTDFRFLYPVVIDRGASLPRRHCCQWTSCVSSSLLPLGCRVGGRDAEAGEASREAIGAIDGFIVEDVPFDGRGGVVHGCGGVPSIIDVGEVLSSSVVPKVAQIQACDKVSSSVDSMSSFVVSQVGGGDMNQIVKPVHFPSNVGVACIWQSPFCASLVSLLGDSRSVDAIHTGAPMLPNVAAIHIANEGMVSVGGFVREDARVSPVVREALRSQPTDGLRQPPLSPVVPVSGAECGDGKDGRYGCRSYAHIV